MTRNLNCAGGTLVGSGIVDVHLGEPPGQLTDITIRHLADSQNQPAGESEFLLMGDALQQVLSHNRDNQEQGRGCSQVE
jgi:hypothetical protein